MDEVGRPTFTELVTKATKVVSTKTHVAYRYIQIDSLHVHFVNEEDEGLIPVWIQVARLDARLLFLANPFALKVLDDALISLRKQLKSNLGWSDNWMLQWHSYLLQVFSPCYQSANKNS